MRAPLLIPLLVLGMGARRALRAELRFEHDDVSEVQPGGSGPTAGKAIAWARSRRQKAEPTYQAIAEEAVGLGSPGMTTADIAGRLGVATPTVKKGIIWAQRNVQPMAQAHDLPKHGDPNGRKRGRPPNQQEGRAGRREPDQSNQRATRSPLPETRESVP